MSSLGPDWIRGPDGVLFRRAARVLVFDAADRLLLARGHDADEPDRSWWFTIGGGIDDGESPRQAAVREVAEETGLRLDPGSLVGPVLARRALFDFYAETVRQDEEFFIARLDQTAPSGGLSRAGWTPIEQDFLDELQWWPLDDLARTPREVFPHGLARLAVGLLAGWDGHVIRLPDDNDEPSEPGEPWRNPGQRDA